MKRAELEIAVEDYGHSRLLEGINRLFRQPTFGVGMLTDDALEQLNNMLAADLRNEERIKRENRAAACGEAV